MTDKSISALEKQHFARSTKLYVYSVFIEDGDPSIHSEDEMDAICRPYYKGSLDFCDVVIKSPLPKDDFKKLAEVKGNDRDFWIKSVLLDNGEVCEYGFGGI